MVLAPIYAPPGEPQIPGISSQRLAELIRERDKRPVAVVAGQDELLQYLLDLMQSGDTILTMGAGDIWQVGHRLAQALARPEQLESRA